MQRRRVAVVGASEDSTGAGAGNSAGAGAGAGASASASGCALAAEVASRLSPEVKAGHAEVVALDWASPGFQESALAGFDVVVLANLPRHEILRLDEYLRWKQASDVVAVNAYGSALRVFAANYKNAENAGNAGDAVVDGGARQTQTQTPSIVLRPQSQRSVKAFAVDGLVSLYDDVRFDYAVGEQVALSAIPGAEALEGRAFTVTETLPQRFQFRVAADDLGKLLPSAFRGSRDAGVVEHVQVREQPTETETETKTATATGFCTFRETILRPHVAAPARVSVYPDLDNDRTSQQLHGILHGLSAFEQARGHLPAPSSAQHKEEVRQATQRFWADGDIKLELDAELCDFVAANATTQHPALLRHLSKLAAAQAMGTADAIFAPGKQQLLHFVDCRDAQGEADQDDVIDASMETLLRAVLPLR